MASLPIDSYYKKTLFEGILEKVRAYKRLHKEVDFELVKFFLNEYFDKLTRPDPTYRTIYIMAFNELIHRLIRKAEKIVSEIEEVYYALN